VSPEIILTGKDTLQMDSITTKWNEYLDLKTAVVLRTSKAEEI
jgi:hypothetical protein